MANFKSAPNLEENKSTLETAVEVIQQPEVAIAAGVLGLLIVFWFVRSLFGRGYDADLEDYMGDDPEGRRR